jgi:hypothetical protein
MILSALNKAILLRKKSSDTSSENVYDESVSLGKIIEKTPAALLKKGASK